MVTVVALYAGTVTIAVLAIGLLLFAAPRQVIAFYERRRIFGYRSPQHARATGLVFLVFSGFLLWALVGTLRH